MLDQCHKVPTFRMTLTSIVGAFAAWNCQEPYKQTVPFLCSHKRFAPGIGTNEWHVGSEGA